jgi:hypothetical protein
VPQQWDINRLVMMKRNFKTSKITAELPELNPTRNNFSLLQKGFLFDTGSMYVIFTIYEDLFISNVNSTTIRPLSKRTRCRDKKSLNRP